MRPDESADDVLTFWLDEIGPKGWYDPPEGLDGRVRERFEHLWRRGAEGALSLWLTYPSGVLAYSVLLDQFPRNMFRGEGRAFSTDRAALAAVKSAVDRKWDCRIDEPARQFFYLPLMHSENLCDQDRSVRLIKERMPDEGGDNMVHARAHREVIRRFGRFPYRNDALQRATTEPEQAFLDAGGYRAALEEVQAPA